MGNRPKTNKLRVLEGMAGHRPLKPEPEPAYGIPEMPAMVSEDPEMVTEWHKLIEIIDGMGILTIADGQVVAQCAYLAVELGRLARELRTEGRVCYTQKMDSLGNEIMEAKSNPKATMQKNLMTEFRMTWGLLGLSPVDRARLSVTDKGKKAKFSGLVGDRAKKQG